VSLVTTVTLASQRGRDQVESDVRVASLDELYRVCRDAPPHRVVRIAIRGVDGEVRLNFASFIHGR
jgi:hypothetical protein